MISSAFSRLLVLNLKLCCLGIGFILLNVSLSLAQTPTVIPSKTETPVVITPTLTTTQSSTVVVTKTATAGTTNKMSLTFADLGNKDITLLAPSGKAVVNLNTPANWEMQPGGRLNLAVDVNFQSKNSLQNADFQINLNGTVIYKTALYTSGLQVFTIPLPEAWPVRTSTGDRFEFEVNFIGPCNPVNYDSITLLAYSAFIFDYQVKPAHFDLTTYPYPLYEPSFVPNQAYLVLPSHVTSNTLAGILAMNAGLSNLSRNRLTITTINESLFNTIEPLSEHLLVAGTPDNNKVINLLQAQATLPISFETRKLQLVMTGFDEVALDSDVTYTIQLTNTTNHAMTNLAVNSYVPVEGSQIRCQPQCEQQTNMVTWTLPSLASGVTSVYTLSFKMPLTTALQYVDLTSQINQSGIPINVSTLHSAVKLIASPQLTHTTPPSNYFFRLNNRAIPETDGIIQFFTSPWHDDKGILLLTGLTDEAIFKAGRALGATTHFPGMQGQTALIQDVTGITDTITPVYETFSLADLGYENRSIVGTGIFDNSYRFVVPLDWRLTEGAFIRLLFSHSPLLDSTSSLTILLNGQPLGTAPLNESNATGGELSSKILAEFIKPGQANTLGVHVEASLANYCNDPNSFGAWVNVDAASMVYLPHFTTTIASQLNLNILPLPFTLDPNLANVMVTLPSQPSIVEYDQAVQIIERLAAATEGDNFRPHVLMGELTNTTNISDYNIIAIGRPSRNPIIQELNPQLPQPFVPNTDVIQQYIDEIIFRLPSDVNLGYVQLLPSKWNSERAILAVTGTTDEGLVWAAQAFADSRLGFRYRGNLAIMRDLSIFALDTRDMAPGNKVRAIVTLVPDATVVGTVTPTVDATLAAMTPTPPLTGELPKRSLPSWLLVMTGGGFFIIAVILGVAYWQHRRRKRFVT